MRKDEVPQDQGIADGLKEVTYAVDENGAYVMVASVGWEPKNISNYQAWDVIGEQIARARLRVINNELSPLAYHMARNQMDVALLAEYMGIMRWRVKRHLNPHIFNKLNRSLLARYASLFKVTVAQLQDIMLAPESKIPGQDRK